MDSEKKQHEALKQWLHRYRELLTDANRLWDRVDELRVRIAAARREIEAAIRKISGRGWADQREVLRLRYIDGLKWEDAAEQLFGDDPKFWDRQDVFLRRAFKLHRAALEALAQFVPLQTGQENNTFGDDRK